MGKEKKQIGKKGKIFLLISIAVMIITVVYFGIAFYFSKHFLPKTYVDSILCEYADGEETLKRLNSQLSEFQMLVKGVEGKEDILSNLSLKTASEEEIAQALKMQNNMAWIFHLREIKNVNIDIHVLLEKDELATKIKELNVYAEGEPSPPMNAYIGPYNPEIRGYEIVEGTVGTLFDEQKVFDIIYNGVKNLEKDVNLVETGCLIMPEIMQDDPILQNNLTTLNQYVRTVIDYDWHGTIESLNGDLIHTWILSSPEGYILDEAALSAYLTNKASQYDTYGKPHNFYTTTGKTVQLPCRSMGWKVDIETELQSLKQDILSGNIIEREPAWKIKAPGKGNNEVGSTYVEIDLGNQNLYLYVDGKMILETELVSGNVEQGHKTPPGIFLLTYKTTDAVLKGDDYESPVKYWMPFNGNIGMHDATWRENFGGDIYKTNGSHGCINLPLKSAATIFDYIYTGLPIICYY